MHNKNKTILEVSRMLDLATFGNNKQKLVKETFENKVNQKKETIKENEEFDFDLGDVFDNDGGGGDLPPEQQGKSDYNLSMPFKLALSAYDLNNMHAALLGMEKDDILTFGDLRSKSVNPNDETGAVEYKASKYLYPLRSNQEFKTLQNRGRLIINFKGHPEELKDTEKVFKWLGGTKGMKDFNLIGMDGGLYKLSSRGKATLDYLARILSGKPEGEDEQNILKYAKDAKYHAAIILKTFYDLASQDFIAAMTGKPTLKNSEELRFFTEEGVAKAIREIANGKYNPSQPVGPFIFQIVKNHVKNEIAKVAKYTPNATNAEREFLRRKKEAMNSGSNLFIVPSRKSPTNQDNAIKVEQEGRIYLYYYDEVADALRDLLKPAPHMKPYHLRADERNTLFDSVRHSASSIGKGVEDVAATGTNPKDDYATEEIKQILGNAVEWMTHDPKKYWVSMKNHSELLNTSQESLPEDKRNLVLKTKKEAKRNIVNFIYDFLIQMGGSEDVGESGKAIFLKDWIQKYNEDTLNQYRDKLPNKNDEEIIDLMKKAGLWISGDVQSLYKGIKDYFTQKPEEYKKMKDLISGAKFDEEEEVMQEQKETIKDKIREKIRKTLMEAFILKEESNITIEMIGTVGERFVKFLKQEENVSAEKLNEEISRILNTGNGKYHLDLGRHGVMRYLTSVLASLFELGSESEKDNIVNYLFSSLFPKGDKSNAAMFLIGRISGLDPKNPNYRETMWSAVTEPQDDKTIIEKALETYNPERGSDFISWIMNRIAQKTKSLSQKEYSYMEKGETKWKNDDSLDSPIGQGTDDEDAPTLMSKIADRPQEDDKDSKDFAKKMIGSFLAFVNKKLEGKTALKEILALFGDERVYNNKGQIDNMLIANILDTSVGAVRKNKNALMNIIRDSITSGELGEFMRKTVGVDIEKYPKIKNFLETGDLVIGTYGSGSSSDEESDYEDNEDEFDNEEEDEFNKRDNFMYEAFVKNFKKYNKIILK
jgi:hypothetical protein